MPPLCLFFPLQVTVIGTVLLVPLVLMTLYVPKAMGVWQYDLGNLTAVS